MLPPAQRRGAVYNNRARLLSEVARAAFKLRGELRERSSALVLDRGGMRRTWLRGRENVHKRYLLHVAGYNLGLLMRLTTGFGAPRGAAERFYAVLIVVNTPGDGFIVAIVVTDGIKPVAAVILDITHPAG